MATYSSNTTIKVSVFRSFSIAVGPTAGGGAGPLTQWTVAANSYAIFTVVCVAFATTTADILIGGVIAARISAAQNTPLTLYAGPGATVAVAAAGGTNSTWLISGVEFLNTP